MSKEKTVYMLMRGKLDIDRLSIRTENQDRIKYVQETKYIGISVGERMNFKNHLYTLRDKMVNAVVGMSRVLRTDWGCFYSITVTCMALFFRHF